ncbi:MAG TPA: NrfD/PsrC family molybdoenzyme membrane anchor subunit [Acidobacteriaceae bacterium]|nr:NrfD/PsrC family molybdoenzyme membrane anchor subunit [Acidobacteriaceae bacterium]
MAEVLDRNLAEVQEHDDKRDVFSQLTPVYDIQSAANPDRLKEPGYYGLPILKRPFWKWEIALYFFFEGVSAGSYILCTMAGLRDKTRFEDLIRGGRFLSFCTMVLCPPLLIIDLGRPERFHHMLRIWKKTSPMNHGAWALTGYGTVASFLALLGLKAEWMPGGALTTAMRLAQRWVPERVIGLLGLPFAWTMVSYPGVLLESTANPLWSRSHFLGPLFASSSMSSGAAALTLLNYGSKDHGLHKALTTFEDVATVAEAASVALYLGEAKKAAQPLWKGKQRVLFLVGAIGLGILAPAVLRRSKSKVVRDAVAPLLTLAGSLALKWSVTYAGQESALDPAMANFNGETIDGKAYWGPTAPATAAVPANEGATVAL